MLNRAPRTRRPSCSISCRTPCTRGSTPRSRRATSPTRASTWRSGCRVPPRTHPSCSRPGTADFAVLDVHDLASPRDRGAAIGAVAPIVSAPLASVIAGDRSAIQRPRDLEGQTVGVTGLPSDDAVLDAVVEADGVRPRLGRAGDDRVRLGRGAVGRPRRRRHRVLERGRGRAPRAGRAETREFRVDGLRRARTIPELGWSRPRGSWQPSSRSWSPTSARRFSAGASSVAERPAVGVENLLAGTRGTGRRRPGRPDGRARSGRRLRALRPSTIDPRCGTCSIGPSGPDHGHPRRADWDRRVLRRLERAAVAELAADRLGPAPHLDDLGPALAEIAQDQLAARCPPRRASAACPARSRRRRRGRSCGRR